MKKEEFPIELIAVRNQKGMTQVDLATGIGVSERSVSLWERGKVIPRIGIRLTLAHYLLGKEQRDYFLFDDELPGGDTAEKKPAQTEAAVLQKYLQEALAGAQVSEVLKKSVSKALESLPELSSQQLAFPDEDK